MYAGCHEHSSLLLSRSCDNEKVDINQGGVNQQQYFHQKLVVGKIEGSQATDVKRTRESEN